MEEVNSCICEGIDISFSTSGEDEGMDDDYEAGRGDREINTPVLSSLPDLLVEFRAWS